MTNERVCRYFAAGERMLALARELSFDEMRMIEDYLVAAEECTKARAALTAEDLAELGRPPLTKED